MSAGEAERGSVLEECSLDLFTYQLDPYAGCAHHCRYCYTLNAARGREVEVAARPHLRRRLEAELARIPPQTIYMGMNTDPYQPVEDEHRRTRAALEILESKGFSVCILTKSDLVLRDLDLLRRMPGSSVGFSVAFVDEDARAAFEDNTIPLEARLEALAGLHAAGIETYALISPVIPLITDVDALIDRLDQCADTVWIYPLHMASRGDPNWRATRSVLERRFPDAVRVVERAAFDPGDDYWVSLCGALRKRARGLTCKLEIHV